MADDFASRMIAATHQKFQKEISDGVAKKCVEMFWLDKNGCVETGRSGRTTEWRHRYQRSSSTIGFSGTEALNYDARNDYVVASLPWRGLADGIAVGWGELLENRGDDQIIDLLSTIPADLRSDAIDAFCTDFHLSGTTRSSKTFHGLAASIGTGLTYAGLSASTYTSWASQYVSGAGYRADPYAKLLSLILSCAVGSKGGRDRNMIDLLLMSSTDFQALSNYLQASQRGPLTGNVDMAKAGFPNIEVNGVPATWSEYMSAATNIWGLNSAHFKLMCCTQEPFQFFHQQPTGAPNPHLFYYLSHMNLQNRNPRASGTLYSTDT